MLTTVKFTEYDISNDNFEFEVIEDDAAPYKLNVSGTSIAIIFQSLTDGSDVAARERCIAMCLEEVDEEGDSTGEYTYSDPCELVGAVASM